MDKAQARLMRSRHLRVVKSKMSKLSAQREEAYERNRGEIDERIKQIVASIVAVQPINQESFTKTIHHVIDSLFYKRPSQKVIQFLDVVCSYPPEVIYDSMLSYSMYLVEKGQKKKNSTNYFLGFLKKRFFKYRMENSAIVVKDESEGLENDI